MRKKDLIPHNFLSHNLHYEKFSDGTVKCIEDEIPFELPEGWEWTRLGCITDVIQYGLSNSAESTGDYRLLRITDIQNGCVNWDTVPFTSTDEPEKYLLHKDDIVFARTGATVGKSFLITDLPYASVYASYLIRIRLINGISANYIYHFFNSYCYWEQVTDKAVGVGQPNCNGTALRELFIPLPSQAEQNRIVPVADKLLKIVDTITSEQESLSELIQTTKSKILDLAIRGKLLPQDPNDEPASVPLERIRAEKEELIKQGKIKRDKKDSVIFKGDDNSYYEKVGNKLNCIDEEISFKLPEGWAFIRLKTAWELISGRDLSPSDYNDKNDGIPYITGASNFKNGHVSLVRWTPVPQVITQKGDLLLTCKGTIGEIAYNNFGKAHIARQIMAIRNNYSLNVDFLALCIEYSMTKIKQAAKGLIPGISREDILNLVIPIPPTKEQEKICDKLKVTFSAIKHIEKAS
ncbi:restriction endonuclease subunit S [Ruminococcoides intestinale]|uniref:restriction endonuclease subunit S n=1 Tax=Ruminococcoides intestinale TaxID=3133162 RepID=UPI00189C5998|nr:restriction endonuclease subunit S [Ruminococcus bromii]